MNVLQHEMLASIAQVTNSWLSKTNESVLQSQKLSLRMFENLLAAEQLNAYPETPQDTAETADFLADAKPTLAQFLSTATTLECVDTTAKNPLITFFDEFVASIDLNK